MCREGPKKLRLTKSNVCVTSCKCENTSRLTARVLSGSGSTAWTHERRRRSLLRWFEQGNTSNVKWFSGLGEYIINWCPRCHTALSNEEAEGQDSEGTLWHIRYPIDETAATAASASADAGADAMVTPCPLCHLNLDGFQPKAAAQSRNEIDLPIIHLPQLVGLAIGLDPKKMGLSKHIISTGKLLSKVAVPT